MSSMRINRAAMISRMEAYLSRMSLNLQAQASFRTAPDYGRASVCPAANQPGCHPDVVTLSPGAQCPTGCTAGALFVGLFYTRADLMPTNQTRSQSLTIAASLQEDHREGGEAYGGDGGSSAGEAACGESSAGASASGSSGGSCDGGPSAEGAAAEGSCSGPSGDAGGRT
jgi:hypothetical protein